MKNNTTKIHVKPETPPDYRISSQQKPKINTRKKFQHPTKLQTDVTGVYYDEDIIEKEKVVVDGDKRQAPEGCTVKTQGIGKCYDGE